MKTLINFYILRLFRYILTTFSNLNYEIDRKFKFTSLQDVYITTNYRNRHNQK